MAALRFHTPQAGAPAATAHAEFLPPDVAAALKRYNAAHPRAPFEAREVRGTHRNPCDGCRADFDGLNEYFVERGSSWSNEKLCLACMEERLEEGNFLSSAPPSRYSSKGSEEWPIVQRGEYGLVYIAHEQRFGYYDDEDDSPAYPGAEDDEEDDCWDLEFSAIVYFEAPLRGPCKHYASYDLQKPPFDGEYVAL